MCIDYICVICQFYTFVNFAQLSILLIFHIWQRVGECSKWLKLGAATSIKILNLPYIIIL